MKKNFPFMYTTNLSDLLNNFFGMFVQCSSISQGCTMWWQWTKQGMISVLLQEDPKYIDQERIRSGLLEDKTISYAILLVIASLEWKLPSMLLDFYII
jgi:hypothetical protein